MRPIYLFLDFDGVCHPCSLRSDRTDEPNRYFCYLPRIESVLREYPQVHIVISSSWRLEYTLEELRSFFTEDLRSRVISTLNQQSDDVDNETRQHLIADWLRENAEPDAFWVALDDRASDFTEDAPLIVCHDKFSDHEEALLRQALERLSVQK